MGMGECCTLADAPMSPLASYIVESFVTLIAVAGLAVLILMGARRLVSGAPAVRCDWSDAFRWTLAARCVWCASPIECRGSGRSGG